MSFIELDAYDNSVIPQISVHCAHVSSGYEDHGFHTCIAYTDFIISYSSNISNIKYFQYFKYFIFPVIVSV